MAKIIIKELTKKFNDKLVLKNINFEIENGLIHLLEILKEIEKYGFIKDIHIERETLREIIKNIYENKK